MRNRGLSLIVVALVALASHAETQLMPRRTATEVKVPYSAEHAALVERGRIAADCLLGGARRSAQSGKSIQSNGGGKV